MIVIKAWYRFITLIQKILFFLLYGTKIKIGRGTTWRRGFSVMKDKEARIEIGENCFFNNDCSINSNNLIKMGGSLFGENVKIYDHNHRFNQHIEIKQQGFSNGSIIIGMHCWIGSNVTILKDTVIGDNCVIGAGSVISENIPANSIVKAERSLTIVPIQYIN